MARRVLTKAEQAAVTFQALALPSPKRRVKTPEQKARAAFERATAEVTAMFKARDFAGAEVRHVVAMHGLLHQAVLGVEEAELAEQFLGALSAASKLCRDAFGGEVAQLLEYVRWAWGREKGREARRRANDDTTGARLAWKWLFVARSTLTDYRVAQHRQQAGART